MNDERWDEETLRSALGSFASDKGDLSEFSITLDEICAYLADALPTDELESVQKRLVLDPEASRLAAAMATFRDARALSAGADTGDMMTVGLSGTELADDWSKLAQRVGIEAHPPKIEPASRPKALLVLSRPWLAPALTAAAGLALAVGVGIGGQARVDTARNAPRVNVEPWVVMEDATRSRGAPSKLLEFGSASYRLLELKLFPDETTPMPDAFDQHAVEIWQVDLAASRRPVWRSTEIYVKDNSTAYLELPRGFLAPGDYELRLFGLADGTQQSLATFAIEVP